MEQIEIKPVVDSRANKTLSQINEEYDEEDHSVFGIRRTPKMSQASTSPISNRTEVSQLGRTALQRAPQLAEQLDQMEVEFQVFLDQVYN